MFPRFTIMALAVAALLGCTNDTRPGPGTSEVYESGLMTEATIGSLSESERLAMCEGAERWLNDSVDLVRLAGISQALQGDPDVTMCEEQIALYESVSTGEDGMVPVFFEGCAVIAARMATCDETVGSFEALITWWATNAEWQLSMLSCDLVTMPEVWREIAWRSADRAPVELRAVRSCTSGS